MTLEAVRISHLFIAIIWLGIQGYGDGINTDRKSLDGNNATTTKSSELKKDLVANTTKEDGYNGTLGTTLWLLASFIFYFWIKYHLPLPDYLADWTLGTLLTKIFGQLKWIIQFETKI